MTYKEKVKYFFMKLFKVKMQVVLSITQSSEPDISLIFRNEKDLQSFIDMLRGVNKVSCVEVEHGSVLVDRNTHIMYITKYPTKKNKGSIKIIDIKKISLNKLADTVYNHFVETGRIIKK